jgi:MFS family permease
MFPPSGKNAPVLGRNSHFLVWIAVSNARSGAIVAIYSAGSCIGNLVVEPLADKISRRWSIAVSGMFGKPTPKFRIQSRILTDCYIKIATVGGILMCAAQNPAMMIVGRLFAGIAAGINISVIPVYISEISLPASRGIMVGIQGTSIAVGYCLANWIGYAGDFAKGNAQWRIPLGIQCFGTLLIGIAPIFLPYTPRWRKCRCKLLLECWLMIRGRPKRPHRRCSRRPITTPRRRGRCIHRQRTRTD